MKILYKSIVFILLISIILIPITGCSETTTTETEQPQKITLDDSPTVLDMSTELPSNFKNIDAASEGMSNKDMELGPDWSEVELFLSENPFQMIFSYMSIIESQVERATADALLKNEEQIKTLVMESLKAGAAEEGVEFAEITVDITYPDLGDMAILGSGAMSIIGIDFKYEILMFRVNKVYVTVCSLCLSADKQSLITVAEGIIERIGLYSQ